MSRSLVLITESHFSWLWLIIFTLFHFCRPPRRHFNKLKQKPLARNFTFTARSQRRFKSGDMAVARFHDRRKFLLGHKWPPNNSDIASRNPFEKTPLSNLPIYQLLLLQRRNGKCWTLETLLWLRSHQTFLCQWDSHIAEGEKNLSIMVLGFPVSVHSGCKTNCRFCFFYANLIKSKHSRLF